jgi:Uma2 family endonuclease
MNQRTGQTEGVTSVRDIQEITPADWVAGPKQGEWTYEDYARLGEGQRYQLIRGVLLAEPGPTYWHQGSAGEIFSYLHLFLKEHKLGRVYYELDVILAPDVTVRPDITVLLNESVSKLTSKGYPNGAPDLAIEVASPGTAKYDRIVKRELYAEYGMPEYWIVRPEEKSVELLILENGSYRSYGKFQGKQTLPSHIVAGFPTSVEQFFTEA